jgi:hypothetical protein
MTAVRIVFMLAVATVFAALAFAAVVPDGAQAHRDRCHQRHTCPSDHATYRWLGRINGIRARWLCVHRFADERNRSFNRRVRYDGRVYYCKR